MSNYYKLDGHKAVPCSNVEWMAWFASNPYRRVARDEAGPLSVSTVFLGNNHAQSGPPLLFETMVFGSGAGAPYDGIVGRCSTWEEAELMHAEYASRYLDPLFLFSLAEPTD